MFGFLFVYKNSPGGNNINEIFVKKFRRFCGNMTASLFAEPFHGILMRDKLSLTNRIFACYNKYG